MRGVDKIFAPLLGKPMVSYVLSVFDESPSVQRIVLVLSQRNLDRGRRLVESGRWSKVADVCEGGERRQDSVRAGLDRLNDVQWVIVHDGARPLIDADMIERGLEEARITGSAVAAVPVTDTVKTAGPDLLVSGTLPRHTLWAAQTPQVFRRDVLADAHGRVTDDVTDDAAMVERLGGDVKLFLGSHRNIKVTTPEDLAVAETLMKSGLDGTDR